MLTKGIIKSIDFTGNTCVVRMPLFENSNEGEELTTTATISTLPGAYNGFKEGDVVIVGFENNKIDQAIVLGKLFLGTKDSEAEGRGSINCSSLNVGESASIPLNTKLTFDRADNSYVSVQGNYDSYKTLTDIVNALQVQEKAIGSTRAQIIDDGEKLGMRMSKVEDLNNYQESRFEIDEASIRAKVSKINDGSGTAFGWNLNENSWTVTSYNDELTTREDGIDILKVDNSGVTIAGNLQIVGYPKDIKIKYAQNEDKDTAPANFVEGDKDQTKTNWEKWTDTKPVWVQNKYIWEWTRTFTYEYDDQKREIIESQSNKIILLDEGASDAIKTASDDATKKANAAQDAAISAAADDATTKANEAQAAAIAVAQGKSTNYYSATDPRNSYDINAGDCWFDTSDGNNTLKQASSTVKKGDESENFWVDIGGELVTNKVTATYVNSLGITTKSLFVYDDTNYPLLIADGTDNEETGHTVKIGGFSVVKDNLFGAAGSATQIGTYSSDGSIGASFKFANTKTSWATGVTLTTKVYSTVFTNTGGLYGALTGLYLSGTNTNLIKSLMGKEATITGAYRVGKRYNEKKYATVGVRKGQCVSDNNYTEYYKKDKAEIKFTLNHKVTIGTTASIDLGGELSPDDLLYADSPVTYEVWPYKYVCTPWTENMYEVNFIDTTLTINGQSFGVSNPDTTYDIYSSNVTNITTSASTGIDGETKSAYGITSTGSIVPDSSNAYSLGTTARRWDFLYSNYCNVSTNISEFISTDTLFCSGTISSGVFTTGSDYPSKSKPGVIADNSGWFVVANPYGQGISVSSFSGNLNGTWKLNGSDIATSSDRNLKHDIEELPEGYSNLFDNLHPVRFKYNDGTSNRYHVGFITQEIERAIDKAEVLEQEFGALVNFKSTKDEIDAGLPETTWALRYGEFIALNTDQIQKAKKRISALEEENNNLKQRIVAIEEKLK